MSKGQKTSCFFIFQIDITNAFRKSVYIYIYMIYFLTTNIRRIPTKEKRCWLQHSLKKDALTKKMTLSSHRSLMECKQSLPALMSQGSQSRSPEHIGNHQVDLNGFLIDVNEAQSNLWSSRHHLIWESFVKCVCVCVCMCLYDVSAIWTWCTEVLCCALKSCRVDLGGSVPACNLDEDCMALCRL